MSEDKDVKRVNDSLRDPLWNARPDSSAPDAVEVAENARDHCIALADQCDIRGEVGGYIRKHFKIDHVTAALSSRPAVDDGLEPTSDEIINLINIVTELDEADALERAYVEVLLRLEMFRDRILTALQSQKEVALEEGRLLGIRQAINAACVAELPKERQSCGRDDSGIALTLQRQRTWTIDAIRALGDEK